MTSKTPAPELLQRYLTNECSDAERQLVDQWYIQMNLEEHILYTQTDEDNLLKRIRTDIEMAELPSKRQGRLFTGWWVYAGGLAATLLLSFGFFYYSAKTAVSPSAIHAREDSTIRITNTDKKVQKYSLPDQSVVWLQPGASIGHPKSFLSASERVVTFTGEGFFDITKDADHPFEIHSGKLKTVVLGTSFNIKAGSDSDTYEVSVVTGSVSVSASDAQHDTKTLLLKPQQRAVYSTISNDLTMNSIDAKKTDMEIWQPISLNFDDAALSEILVRLQKTFRVKITLSNPALADCVLKVDFDNQNLPEILEMINALLGSSYEMNGQHIVLSGSGCGGH